MSVLQPLQSSSSNLESCVPLISTQIILTHCFLFFSFFFGRTGCGSDGLYLCAIFCALNCKLRARSFLQSPNLQTDWNIQENCTEGTHAHAITPLGGRLKSIWLRRRFVKAWERREEGDRNVKGRMGRGRMRDAVNWFFKLFIIFHKQIYPSILVLTLAYSSVIQFRTMSDLFHIRFGLLYFQHKIWSINQL